ncbi:MAG: hypothetical protein HUJ65_02405 [Oscillospiraceae bacterium]|nr:hypothetical protein [Oscillospiraceae bacterium]
MKLMIDNISAYAVSPMAAAHHQHLQRIERIKAHNEMLLRAYEEQVDYAMLRKSMGLLYVMPSVPELLPVPTACDCDWGDDGDAPTRTCVGCRRTLPLDEFKRCYRGYTDRCLDCLDVRNQKIRERKEEIRSKAASAPEGYCVCYRCMRVKPRSAFGKSSKHKSGIYPVCKLCRSEITAEQSAKKRMKGLMS